MPASEPLSIAHGAAIDRAHEAAAMRAIKWMRVLPRPLVRTRIKKLVGEEVYRCIDASAPTTVVHGGMGPLVLNLLPFFKHAFVTMCPTCPGVEDSSALMPLLEQGFVVPVLLGPTASYPARFIQHIAAYPHIPAIVYFYLQVAQLEIHERGWAKPHLCLNCFANLHNELIQEINDRVASIRESHSTHPRHFVGDTFRCEIEAGTYRELRTERL